MNRFSTFALLVTTFASLTLGGCTATDNPVLRYDVAKRLAMPAWMIERPVQAGSFSLTAFERMHEYNAPANIYIEGDGMVWDYSFATNKKTLSNDPTPANPVALHLATRDKAQNVAYLSRPCQYLRSAQNDSCDSSYWTDRRFAGEVIDAYNRALDDIARRYDIDGFNLVGFDGGGTLALLLAAQRPDVLSVRTVAGVLDHKVQNRLLEQPVANTPNPPDFAAKLRGVPQYHFFGGQDNVVQPAVAHSYLQAVGESNCVQSEFIQEAAHEEGWVDKWPELLARPVDCGGHGRVKQAGDYFDGGFDALPGDFYTPDPGFHSTREVPEKP
jgi:pimeloyl-ACP methyl ester carboxylesterase